MLVLSRGPGESICVDHAGERCEIKLLYVRPGQVRVGLSAPQSFEIVRAELLPGHRRFVND